MLGAHISQFSPPTPRGGAGGGVLGYTSPGYYYLGAALQAVRRRKTSARLLKDVSVTAVTAVAYACGLFWSKKSLLPGPTLNPTQAMVAIKPLYNRSLYCSLYKRWMLVRYDTRMILYVLESGLFLHRRKGNGLNSPTQMEHTYGMVWYGILLSVQVCIIMAYICTAA